ncbi:hypothetical protein GGP90_001842 [Salinibacter ruber]|nr:hypothetical protein [Salinibacter ruber]MCS3757058.1 hypothetical protein [Salinibacter ruber]MCS3955792.1 hypothetical protein [Salinibacter ruber]
MGDAVAGLNVGLAHRYAPDRECAILGSDLVLLALNGRDALASLQVAGGERLPLHDVEVQEVPKRVRVVGQALHVDVVERRIGRGKDRKGGILIAKGFGEIRGLERGGEGAKVVVVTDNLDY